MTPEVTEWYSTPFKVECTPREMTQRINEQIKRMTEQPNNPAAKELWDGLQFCNKDIFVNSIVAEVFREHRLEGHNEFIP